MALLQAYQADLLGDLDRSEGVNSDDIRELRRATDLSLRATKETARAIGRSMAALVAKGPSCACPFRQYIGGLLHQPSGGSAFASTIQTGAPGASFIKLCVGFVSRCDK